MIFPTVLNFEYGYSSLFGWMHVFEKYYDFLFEVVFEVFYFWEWLVQDQIYCLVASWFHDKLLVGFFSFEIEPWMNSMYY